ncbi:Intimal thickness related receptor IRP domain-containing protein [Plasmodiophora brassicae]
MRRPTVLLLLLLMVVGARARTVTFRSGNGTVVGAFTAVTFSFANTSFSVTARPFLVGQDDQASFRYPEAGRARLLFVELAVSIDAVRQARACERIACLGLVSTGAWDTSGYLGPWVYKPTAAPDPFTSVPIMAADDPVRPALQSLLASDPDTLVTIESGGISPVEAATTSPVIVVAYSLTFVMSALLGLHAVGKLLAFLVDARLRLRPMPLLSFVVFCTQTIASVSRSIRAGDFVLSRSQGLSYTVWRVNQTLFLPFHYLTTLAMSATMYDMESSALSQARHATRDRVVHALTAVIALACAYDIGNTVYVSVAQREDSSVVYIIAVYLMITLPISTMFIVYGRRVANALASTTMVRACAPGDADRRIRFATRTAMSGVVGVLCMADLVWSIAVAVLNRGSVPLLASSSVGLVVQTVEGILFVSAFVIPDDSIVHRIVATRHATRIVPGTHN